MRPSRDPNNEDYANDPNRRFYRGQWRTLEQIEKVRSQDPSQDPNNEDYANDPNRQFYGGQWRTQEQIEKTRKSSLEYQKKKREKKRLSILAKHPDLFDRKVAALIRMASDDRPTANQHEKDLAINALRRMICL